MSQDQHIPAATGKLGVLMPGMGAVIRICASFSHPDTRCNWRSSWVMLLKITVDIKSPFLEVVIVLDEFK